MWPALLSLLACPGQDAPAPDSPAPDSPADDSAPPEGLPAAQVDVLILGAGPAGLSAAWEAQAAGAEVLVLEMEAVAGGSGWWAQNFYAAGTALQASRGVSDSPAVALAEWAALTGGDPDDPQVRAFVEGSAATLDWLESLGAQVVDLVPDLSMGATPRSHRVLYGEDGAVGALVEPLGAVTWLNTRAERLVSEGDRVVGAAFTALDTGETGWVQARVVLVATGGFARDPARLLADRPELAGVQVAFEAGPHSLGLGLDLLGEAGASAANPGHSGVYVHAVADPREGYAEEALWVPGLFGSLFVDGAGARVANEEEARGFNLVDHLLDAPTQRLFALVPASLYEAQPVVIPPYNAVDGVQELDPLELVALGAVLRCDTVAEAAAGIGAEAAALEATVARYEALAAVGRDQDFGKEPRYLVPFEGGPYYVLELVAGSAKSFGGAAVDLQGRVLDVDGQAIPGLYAAGEVAGFLGTDATGTGFGGAVNAAYWGGRVAGQAAAAEARGD